MFHANPRLSFSLCLCSWTGVCSDHHHHRGHDSDGGSDHLPAQPLQALHLVFHNKAEPGSQARPCPAAGQCLGVCEWVRDKKEPLCYWLHFPGSSVLSAVPVMNIWIWTEWRNCTSASSSVLMEHPCVAPVTEHSLFLTQDKHSSVCSQ